jgi:hypothetical protein
MKKEYNIKDKVWIHIGERKLVEGRVVEVIDLEHLKEGHRPDQELYIIELKTGIDDIYEVRNFEQISPDAAGPINLFRKIKTDILKNQRYLNKVGIKMPVDGPDPLVELAKEINDELAGYDEGPTTEEIHAAIDKSLKETEHAPLNLKTEKPKRRYFKKKK